MDMRAPCPYVKCPDLTQGTLLELPPRAEQTEAASLSSYVTFCTDHLDKCTTILPGIEARE